MEEDDMSDVCDRLSKTEIVVNSVMLIMWFLIGMTTFIGFIWLFLLELAAQHA